MGILHAFLASADFFLNRKKLFEKKYFRNTTRVSKSLDPDQARRFIGPDLGPDCLQKLSADDTSRQKSAFSHFNGRRIFFRKRIGIVPMRKPFHGRCFE